jgi:two-component system cell cycle sensor histidine kinase/response regulator CckA
MTCRDVTESHRLTRQLDLAKRVGSLGRVAATIAHEFNNVLMGIEPFAEIIRRRVKNDEKAVKAADQISSSVRRGRRVTDEILRFTRPVELVLQQVDLKAWLLQLEPELRAPAGPNARIILSLPNDPAVIACDPEQLQQVLANLILNARDSIGAEGTITVGLRLPAGAGAAELSVRDGGAGIPPNDVFNIFEPLFTTKRGGTGLGLSVARQIVTQHDGSIEAFNHDGGGAEFRITIPCGAVAPSAFATLAAGTRSPVHKLLLVEDEIAVSDGLSMLLDGEGFSVQCVALGAAVADAIAASMPDCVILDLTLPDMDGMDVFRIVRKLWPRLPVVFLTGHGGESQLAEALESGHAGLLQKPYGIDALIDAVRDAAAA